MAKFNNPVYPISKSQYGFPYTGQHYQGLRQMESSIESPSAHTVPLGQSDDVLGQQYRYGGRMQIDLPGQQSDPTQPTQETPTYPNVNTPLYSGLQFGSPIGQGSPTSDTAQETETSTGGDVGSNFWDYWPPPPVAIRYY